MTLHEGLYLAVPLVLDWLWDRFGKKRVAVAKKQSDEQLERTIRALLNELGEQGEAIAKKLGALPVPTEIAPEVSTITGKLRRAASAMRLTSPPPVDGGKKPE